MGSYFNVFMCIKNGMADVYGIILRRLITPSVTLLAVEDV
jgi:hypothetical protein